MSSNYYNNKIGVRGGSPPPAIDGRGLMWQSCRTQTYHAFFFIESDLTNHQLLCLHLRMRATGCPPSRSPTRTNSGVQARQIVTARTEMTYSADLIHVVNRWARDGVRVKATTYNNWGVQHRRSPPHHTGRPGIGLHNPSMSSLRKAAVPGYARLHATGIWRVYLHEHE